jgi:hypothetical protein
MHSTALRFIPDLAMHHPVLPVLNLPKESCRRVRIEKRFEESRLEKVFNEPERLQRPFILRQAQYERK